MSDYENSKNSTSSNNEDNCYCDVCNHDTTYCGCEDNGCCECGRKFIDIRSIEFLSQRDEEGAEWYNEKKYEYFENFKLINLWGEDEDDYIADTNDFLVELSDAVEKGMKQEQPKIFEEIHQSTNIPTELCNIISQMSIDDISFVEETKYEDLFNEIVDEHQDYLTDYKIVELTKLDVCQFNGETFFVCQDVDIRESHYAFNINFDNHIYELSYDGKDEYKRETYKNIDNFQVEDLWIVQQAQNKMWLVIKTD
jgi:hypothetical protein